MKACDDHHAAGDPELLAQLAALDSPIGYMCISLPAAINLLRIPGIPAEARRRARELRNANLER